MALQRAVAHPKPPPSQFTPPLLGTDPAPPHPEVTERTSRGDEEREIVIPGVDDGPRALAYGEQWLSGKIQFVTRSVYDPSRILYVVELCAGECDALLGVLLPDGNPAPLNSCNVASIPRVAPYSLSVWWYPGTPSGFVDANILRNVASWNESFAGTCYAVVELVGFGTFWTQIPNLIFRMRTRKALDPETGLHVYSTNPFVQWYDFLRWSEGKALATTRINTQSFIDAKHIAHPTSGPKLFDSHLLLMEQTDPDDVIKSFRLMTDSMWIWDANQYRVVVDRPRASVATITNNAVVKSKLSDGGRGDVLERPNKVTVWYTDIANGRNLVPVSVTTAALDAGLEDEVEEVYRLPWLHDASIAKSRARYILESRLYDLTVNETWNMTTAARQLGDRVIREIPERGLIVDSSIVRRVKNPDNTFDVTLLEYNEAKFTPEIESTPARVSSTLPDITAPPENVDPLSFTINELFYREGIRTGKTRAKLAWTNPDAPFFERVDIYLAVNGDAEQFVARGNGNATDAVEYLFSGVMELNVPYAFRLVSVSTFGIPSSGTSKTVTFLGKQTPPKDVAGITARTVNGEVVGTIQPSDDPDILGFEVRRIAEGDVGRVSAPYSTTDPVAIERQWNVAAVIDPFNGIEFRDPAPFTAWRYLVKAYDGIRYSVNAKHVVIANMPAREITSAGIVLQTFSQVPVHGMFSRRGSGEACVEHYADGSARVMLARRITAAQLQDQIAAIGAGATIGDWAALNPGPLCFPLQTGVDGQIDNSANPYSIGGTSQRNFEYRFHGRTSERLGVNRPGVTPFARATRNGITGPVSFDGHAGGSDGVNQWGFRLGTNDPWAQEIVHNVGIPAEALIQFTKESS